MHTNIGIGGEKFFVRIDKQGKVTRLFGTPKGFAENKKPSVSGNMRVHTYKNPSDAAYSHQAYEPLDPAQHRAKLAQLKLARLRRN